MPTPWPGLRHALVGMGSLMQVLGRPVLADLAALKPAEETNGH